MHLAMLLHLVLDKMHTTFGVIVLELMVKLLEMSLYYPMHCFWIGSECNPIALLDVRMLVCNM